MTPEQPTSVPPGWYPDPHGVAELRWWDGADWTDHLHNSVTPAETAEPAATEPTVHEQVATQPTEAATAAPISAAPAAVDPALNFPPPAYHPPGQIDDDSSIPVFDLDYEPQPAAAQFAQPALPQEQPQQQELDAAHDSVPDGPSPMHDLFSAATPFEQAATAPALPETTPAEHSAAIPEAVAAVPAPVTDPNRLPSRRELRERGETLAQSLPEHDAPVHEPPVHEAPGFEAPTQEAAPAVTPAQQTPAFDTSVPTSFDWTADAPIAPSLPDPATSAESAPDAPPAALAPAALPPTALPPAALPPDSLPLPTQALPDTAVGTAWGTQDEPSVLPAREIPLPTLQSTTISSLLIAFMPLISGLLSLGAVKGAENYPRYAPAGASWWMLVAVVLAILYLVTAVLAVADRRKLDSFGHGAPAHWAWAFATAPVYLVMRMFAIKRETGRMTSQLWVWIILTLALVGAYLAAVYFAPALVSAYTLPFQ